MNHFYPKYGEWETLEQAFEVHTVAELNTLAAALPGERIGGRKGERIEHLCQRMTGKSLRDLWSRLTELQQAAVALAVHAPDASFSPAGFRIRYGGLCGSSVMAGLLPRTHDTFGPSAGPTSSSSTTLRRSLPTEP